MAAPVITAASSIAGYKRNEQFELQLYATNTPTTWAAAGLPAGVSINASTGLISGSAATAGGYNVIVTATNAGAESGTQMFFIGISSEVAASAGTASSAADLDIDLSTLDVSLSGSVAVSDGTPLFAWKRDDKLLLAIRYKKGDAYFDPDPSVIRLVTKEYEPDAQIFSAETFEKITDGDDVYFLLLVEVNGDALDAALGNYEADAGTQFDALCEIETEFPVTFDGDTITLRRTTATFPARLIRDLAAN